MKNTTKEVNDKLEMLGNEVCLYGGQVLETGCNYIRFVFHGNDYVMEKMSCGFMVWAASKLFKANHIMVKETESPENILKGLANIIR